MSYEEIVKQWQSYNIGKGPDIDKYLHSFRVLFADGNGRVGRALLNYYLMINNRPPVIIYEEDKKNYYEALNVFDEKLVIDDLYEFLKQQCVKTWGKCN